MRIRRIQIRQWRHFENIDLQLDAASGLVCIVGANGTGKSHLLELIAACAHRLGISPGIEIPRGDPFSDFHDFSMQLYIAEGVSSAIDEDLAKDQFFPGWDRTLTIRSKRLPNEHFTRIEAGGIADSNQCANFAQRVVDKLNGSQNVHFLSLDADRAYPQKNINIHEIAAAYEIDWAGLEYTRGRSFRTTTTLYDEWIKYFLAQENQSGTRLMQGFRRAKKSGGATPEFDDPFESYSASLQKVLPYVFFTGIDPKRRTLIFDTTGLELSFNQLSGGEREIAFLIGQIDRFGLRQGLFLLDEPELHLNADLIRIWVAYLTGTVKTGQVWLATHSLEAVESAGQQSTFVLERNDATRKVDSLVRLDARPVLSALSRAVGTPAFSISKLRFVFVEGEEGVGEREQFQKLAGAQSDLRFLECGSCNEVLRRVSAIKSLAHECEVAIRVGGVVDRDFRTEESVNSISGESGVLVLPLHEGENFFLHPPTLSALLRQNGIPAIQPLDLIRDAADRRAGSWIFQNAMATKNAGTLPPISVAAKENAKAKTWSQIEADRKGMLQAIVDVSGYNADNQAKLRAILDVSANSYERKRLADDLWKVCEGKQVLNNVAQAVGFANKLALTQAVFTAWATNDGVLPDELKTFREYLSNL